jgi:hypothetical protein
MSQIIKAPTYLPIHYRQSVFIAGGISGCRDWQSVVVERLKDRNVTLINPRREDYSDSPEVAKEQIIWEHTYLGAATHVLFWFCEETLCPITLFELGAVLTKGEQEIFIGMDSGYKRKLDVFEQSRLREFDKEIRLSLDSFIEKVRGYLV